MQIYCVGFGCTVGWFSCAYAYICVFFRFFPYYHCGILSGVPYTAQEIPVVCVVLLFSKKGNSGKGNSTDKNTKASDVSLCSFIPNHFEIKTKWDF